MILPEEASIIDELARDWDDDYVIGAGRIYCFEFYFMENEAIDITITHTKVPAQDLSLRCWFALRPLGETAFENIDSMDYFPAVRHIRTITLGSESSDEQYKMPAMQTLYMMVQNMQNSENLFKLSFNIKA